MDGRAKKERCDLTVAVAPNDDAIEWVVAELNRICKNATLDFAMSVGRLIVDNFYSGNLDAWRYRGPKSVSFRKLAKHPALPMSPSGLYRSVAIYEVCTRLEVNSWRHVSTSHVRLVLGLPKQEQSRLLCTTETEHWPVRRLRNEVAALNARHPVYRRESPSSTRARLGNTIRRLTSCLDETGNLVGAGDAIADLAPGTAHSFAAIVRRMRQACEVLEGHLQERLARAGNSRRADLPGDRRRVG